MPSTINSRATDAARQAVERFVTRFEPSYRLLVYYAALPLALTPELVHALRNRFLRDVSLPYVAEVDLLLSDLCQEVGYELYAMPTPIRGYAMRCMKTEVGHDRMEQVARWLLGYLERIVRRNPLIGRQELQAQRWAALVCIADERVQAVQAMISRLHASLASAGAPGARSHDTSELLGLSRLVQACASELDHYPDFVEYAQVMTQLLTEPAGVSRAQLQRTYRVEETLLPDLTGVARLSGPPVEAQEHRKEAAPPREFTWIEPRTGTEFEFVWAPPGRFLMGQTEKDQAFIIQTLGEKKYEEYGYARELPQHEVVFERGFYIGKYPVTQAQWRAVMRKNPSYFDKKQVGADGERHPVENVSWDACQEFLQKLNQLTPLAPSLFQREGGGGELLFRLPSEAEWEYACRAGSEGLFCYGDDPERLNEYAWYAANSENRTHPVGQLRPNAWGLYDMHGNVWEWCQDAWHNSYDGAPADGRAWEADGDANLRLLRGGSCFNVPVFLRCARRDGLRRGYLYYLRGLRLSCAAFGQYV